MLTDHLLAEADFLAEARSHQRRMIVLSEAAGARGRARRTRALRALATARRLCAIPILRRGAKLVSYGMCAFCTKLIGPCADKATIQGATYHARCLEDKLRGRRHSAAE
jgi:hypothetical protein